MLIRLFAVFLCLFSFVFSGCKQGKAEKKESYWSRHINAEWLETAKIHKTESGEFTVYCHGDFSRQPAEEGYQIRISGEIAVQQCSEDGNQLYFCHNLVYNTNDSSNLNMSGEVAIYGNRESLAQWIESNK